MDKRFRISLGVLAFAIVIILAQQYMSRLLGQNGPIQTGVPSALKIEAITILNGCLPSGIGNLDKEISRAADRIQASLDRRFWDNDFSLNCEVGSEVFDRERQSIQKISDEMKKKLFPQALVGNLMRAMINLMDADRILVQTLISEARRVPDLMTEEIRQAEEELSRAERERANNRFDNAVEHYKYAWIHACAARGPETNLPLNVILDIGGTMGVATVTPDQEATIEAFSGEGTRYILTVPSGAIINPDGQTITMTPIFEIENFPLSGGFLAGVHLEPEGLLFFRPIVLTIVLPAAVPATGLMGFSHQQSSGGFGLTTVQSQGAVLTLELLHFTDEGIGLGSSTDCSGLLDTTLTPEARDKTIINCIITSSGGLDNVGPAGEQIIIEAMQDWFNFGVMPQLSAALSDDSLIESAINSFLSWDKANQLLGSIGDMLQQQTDDGIELSRQIMANSISRNENACVDKNVRTEKIDLIKKLLRLQKMIDALGFGDLQEVRDAICGGAFTEPDNISLTPEFATLSINESTTLTAEAKNFAGESIPGEKLVLAWENSNPTVADLADMASSGYVYAKTAGSTEITVIATRPFIPGTDIRDSSQITVAEVASVEVQPATKRILIDGTVTLTVIVKDTVGNVITDPPIDWSIPAGGVVSFDPISQVATGKAVGSATLTATCEGKSGSSTITVVDIGAITVTPETSSVFPGEAIQLTAIAHDMDGNLIGEVAASWSSFNPDNATVDSAGLVQAIKRGGATIDATFRGRTARATIYIDRSEWKITWQAVIDDSLVCAVPWTYGEWSGVYNHTWTAKGLNTGEIIVRTRARTSETEFILGTAVGNLHDDHYLRADTICPASIGGGTASVLSQELRSWQPNAGTSEALMWTTLWDRGGEVEIQLNVSIGNGIYDTHTEGTICGGVSEPYGTHDEGEGSTSAFWAPRIIPAVDSSGNLFSLTTQTNSYIQMGLNDTANVCPTKGVFTNWTITIARIR